MRRPRRQDILPLLGLAAGIVGLASVGLALLIVAHAPSSGRAAGRPDARTVADAAPIPVPVLAAAVAPGEARLGLVLSGIGLDHEASLAAIAALPGAVDLAFSPYAAAPAGLALAARSRGHETLASIPMEPAEAPLSDEGDHEIEPAADAATNFRNLDWSLSALAGEAGATDAEAGQLGTHVADAPGTRDEIEGRIASRGLFYVEGNPGRALSPGTRGVVADIAVGRFADEATLRAALATLEADAEQRGTATGVLGPLTEPGLQRVVAWLRTLSKKGVVLVPAGSLARQAPAGLVEADDAQPVQEPVGVPDAAAPGDLAAIAAADRRPPSVDDDGAGAAR